MKNKQFALTAAIFIALILYGLFSLHIALGVLWRPQQVDNSRPSTGEIITLSGNKIVYYNI